MSSSKFSIKSRIQLNNGLSMPRLHLGVYLMTGREAYQSVHWALEAGYRAIDSAQMYRNEAECGKAIREFVNSNENINRSDIHFTSKLASNSTYGRARKLISQSVKTCGLEYIDLFLLHSPYGGKEARLESWRAVEDAIDAGEIKSGGVSNYGIKHLEELLSSKPRHFPVTNQIEVHPFNTRRELAEWCQKHDVVVEAYAPLVRAMRMSHPTVASLAKKYDYTPAQLLVRWSLQHGYVALPKSKTKERIVNNVQIDGKSVSDADVKTMDALDEYLVTDWDPTDAD